MNQAYIIVKEFINFADESGFLSSNDMYAPELLDLILANPYTPLKRYFKNNPDISSTSLQLYLRRKIPEIVFHIASCDSIADIIKNHTTDQLCTGL